MRWRRSKPQGIRSSPLERPRSGRPLERIVVTGTGLDESGPPLTGPLAAVRRFIVPWEIVQSTLETLKAAGERGGEAFVVWGGGVEGEVLQVAVAIAPRQQARTTATGLLVGVDGASLFALNRELYTAGQLLGAQVHSHPTDAFHSDTDDHFPLATLSGALSVVVPDFASRGLRSLPDWAFYRLVGQDKWRPLSRIETVEIVP